MSNTIHDMGGMHGFGPVEPDDDLGGRGFHEAWEGRLWGVRQAVIRSGKLKLRPGENRGIIETMGNAAYLQTPYYERFLRSTIDRRSTPEPRRSRRTRTSPSPEPRISRPPPRRVPAWPTRPGPSPQPASPSSRPARQSAPATSTGRATTDCRATSAAAQGSWSG